jgi:cytochrome c-type biogenesis protein CcmH
MRDFPVMVSGAEAPPALYPSPQGGGRRLTPHIPTLFRRSRLAPLHPSPAKRGEGWGRLGRDSLGLDAHKLVISNRGKAGLGALVLAAMLLIIPAHAVTPGEMLPDPAMEARARAITGELRCLVCQNQSVDDSDASLARDLRVLVREKLKEGMSDAQVKEYVHSRYGDFVLLRPPVKPGTILLWTAPLIALLAGGLAVWSAARRRRAPAGPSPLTAEEHERLKALGVESDKD